MNRKLALIIGIQAFLIVMLFWVLVFYGKDEYEASTHDAEDTIEAPNRVSTKQGLAVITLNAATQVQSDITASVLKTSTHQGGISSYGNVIGLDTLIELRSRYLAAKADAQVFSTSLAHNKNEFVRLRELNLDDKNVSDKVLSTALADTKSDEAKVLAAESSAKSIADSMRQAWGDSLTKLATEKNPGSLFQNLIDYKEVLIQITLPFDAPEPTTNSHVMIAPTTASSYAVTASYLSKSPMSNATVQGKTYFYHAKTTALRAGMQVKVLSLNSVHKVAGVVIPATAVVWYGGKPWVYRKIGDTQFSRLPINTNTEVDNGWFYQSNLKGDLTSGDQVVTSGAQLLLSEEFKSQITNENED
ncbi:MAG: hypothetical protein Q7T88_04730 [Methylotenera sp.]|nr:hypothetical protein [Methylotenera sp.]